MTTPDSRERDRAALERQLKRTEARRKLLERREWELRRDIERAKLLELVGQSDAVRVRTRLSGRWAVLNDLFGTITKARRTRASVDFGPPHGVLDISLDDLRPASESQGFLIRATPQEQRA